MVSLTGSIPTGVNIVSSGAATMKRTHMELGGKAPVILFDDADIDAAVEGIRAFGFYNAGQDCTAACRIYAQKGIYDEFVRKLGEAVSTIKTGLQDDESTELGPLITAAPPRPRAGLYRARQGRSRTFRSSPVAKPSKGRASSSNPPCWPAPARTTRSSSARYSARWCRSPL